MQPIIIIGTGLAGYNLAKEFRKLNTEQALCIISHDDGSSYSKPMLSNAFAKNKSPDALAMADAEKMAADLCASIITQTSVIQIDPDANRIQLDNGDTLQYSQLVLAVGAKPVVLDIDGAQATDMFYVNNLLDYRRFYAAANAAQSVAIIGPGLIGCEFANDLVTQGKNVTVIGPGKTPLGHLLPEATGHFFQQQLSLAGINWQLQTTVARIEHDNDQYHVTMNNGETLLVDIILSAVGLTPGIELAQAAGLKTDCGIVVDHFLRSGTANIYALGDCAQVAGLVLPFIMPLMQGSRALAKTLNGQDTAVSYPAMPVLVKTPDCPTIVAPPAKGARGEWQCETSGTGVTAKFVAANGHLLGFTLCGDAVQLKQELTKQLPAILDQA